MITAILLATVLASASGFSIDYCDGCTKSLFRESPSHDVQVTPADVGRIVVTQIDEMDLAKFMEKTVPDLTDKDKIFFTPTINAESYVEKQTPAIRKMVDDFITSEDPMIHEDVTHKITSSALTLIQKYMGERNKIVAEKREMRLNQVTSSVVNELWTVTSAKIRDESLDTRNVNSTQYLEMVKELLPELAKSSNYSGVERVLMYPVIADELSLVIKRDNNTGSVQELTEKMIKRLQPFIREGVMDDIKKVETPNLEKATMEEIDGFLETTLKMATKEGMEVAGKLQNALDEEMDNHSLLTSYIEMVTPVLKEGVDTGMKRLFDDGVSSKGQIQDNILVHYLLWKVRYKRRPEFLQSYHSNAFSKKFQNLIKSRKTLPNTEAVNTFVNTVVYPKVYELVTKNVEEFRHQNPQLTKCETSVLAATVVGSMKAKVKSLAEEYVTNMKDSVSTSKTDIEAAVTHVLEMLKESLPERIEEEAFEQGNFESKMFKMSKTYDEVKLQVESSIYSIVTKTLKVSEE